MIKKRAKRVQIFPYIVYLFICTAGYVFQNQSHFSPRALRKNSHFSEKNFLRLLRGEWYLLFTSELANQNARKALFTGRLGKYPPVAVAGKILSQVESVFSYCSRVKLVIFILLRLNTGNQMN